VGSMQTTPTEVLEVALFQTPLDLASIKDVGLTVCRVKWQGEWRDKGLGHIKLHFFWKHPCTLNQDRILSVRKTI
jgi:hypothetical protein